MSRFSSIVQQAQLQRGDGPPVEIVPGDESALSESETQALDHYEGVIERGLKTFVEVGAALTQVRDLRLYRVGYPTFEAYCDDRWGLGRRRAYQIIDAATAAQNVQNFTQTPPTTESHAAALACLKDPAQQREAWQQAVQRAHDLGQRVTAALVEAVVRELYTLDPAPAENGPIAPPAPPPTPQTDTPDQTPAPGAARPQEPAHATTDLALDDLEAVDWPDDLAGVCHQLEAQGYELASQSEARMTYEHPATGDVVRIVMPPDPGVVRVRVVARQGTDWPALVAQLAQVGVELDTPRSGHLPKYPGVLRAYGTIDLAAQQPVEQATPIELAALRAELAQARQEVERLEQENAWARAKFSHLQRLIKESHTHVATALRKAEEVKTSPLSGQVRMLAAVVERLETALTGPPR